MTNRRLLMLISAIVVTGPAGADANGDVVRFRQNGQIVEATGNVLAQDISGTILLEGLDSRHYFIAADERLHWEKSERPVPLYSREQLRAHLRRELGPQFRIETARNYLIAYSCSPEFASQTGQLLDRVHNYFVGYFRNKGGFQFQPLSQPLVAVLYKSRAEYLQEIAKLDGTSLEWSGGVYSQRTNRFYTYEQTLEEDASAASASRDSSAVERGVRIRNVEVIVHEGIHQLAFNYGFHHRYSYNPKWLAEGLAMYFESADLDSHAGWSGAGRVNDRQLQAFAEIYPQLESGFLQAIVVDDSAFTDPAVNSQAYATAWALSFYLMRAKTRGYVRYLRTIREREVKPYTQEERIADFKAAFGKTPAAMELDFRRFIAPMLSGSTGKK